MIFSKEDKEKENISLIRRFDPEKPQLVRQEILFKLWMIARTNRRPIKQTPRLITYSGPLEVNMQEVRKRMKKFRATGNLPTRPYQQHAENLGFRSCSAIVHSGLEHILFRETILSPRTPWSFESSWSKLNEWWRNIWFYWPVNIFSYLYARDWSSRDDWSGQWFCWVSEVSNKIKLNTKNHSRVLLNYLINWEKNV